MRIKGRKRFREEGKKKTKKIERGLEIAATEKPKRIFVATVQKSLTKYKKGALGGVEEDDYLVVKVC